MTPWKGLHNFENFSFWQWIGYLFKQAPKIMTKADRGVDLDLLINLHYLHVWYLTRSGRWEKCVHLGPTHLNLIEGTNQRACNNIWSRFTQMQARIENTHKEEKSWAQPKPQLSSGIVDLPNSWCIGPFASFCSCNIHQSYSSNITRFSNPLLGICNSWFISTHTILTRSEWGFQEADFRKFPVLASTTHSICSSFCFLGIRKFGLPK